MMDCSEVLSLIPAYCSGELDDEQRRQVEEHLASCPTCRHEVDREESLRQTLSGQASDDPPPGYWDGFDTGLRARIRGTVGVLWGLGCLPGAIAGLVGGVIAFVLTFSSAAEGLLDRIGFIGVLIIALCTGLALGLAFRVAFKRADRRISASLGQDESTLKRLIRANPVCRAVFIFLSVVFCIGVPAYISIMFAQAAGNVPITARILLAPLAFLALALGCGIFTVRYIRSNRGRLRPTRIDRALALLHIAALMSMILWQMSIDLGMHAPSKVRDQAESAYRAGNTRSAIAMLRNCIRKQPDSPWVLECYELLGEIYKDKGQPVQARAAYREGIQAYEHLLAHPHYNYTTSDRSSMAFHASLLYEDLGNECKADELRRLYNGLDRESDY